VSQSHALDNLICLCQKCHLTEEAKVQDQWGGHTPQLPTRYPPCRSCGKPCAGVECYTCRSGRRPAPICPCCGAMARSVFPMGCKACLTPWVLEQRKTRTLRDIAAELGCSHVALLSWKSL
jgi:hypothetical protein